MRRWIDLNCVYLHHLHTHTHTQIYFVRILSEQRNSSSLIFHNAQSVIQSDYHGTLQGMFEKNFRRI